MLKLLYKPLGLLISNHRWRKVLLAATIQGAVFGLVKAAIDRGGATGFRKLTGTWPGKSPAHSVVSRGPVGAIRDRWTRSG